MIQDIKNFLIPNIQKNHNYSISSGMNINNYERYLHNKLNYMFLQVRNFFQLPVFWIRYLWWLIWYQDQISIAVMCLIVHPLYLQIVLHEKLIIKQKWIILNALEYLLKGFSAIAPMVSFYLLLLLIMVVLQVLYRI